MDAWNPLLLWTVSLNEPLDMSPDPEAWSEDVFTVHLYSPGSLRLSTTSINKVPLGKLL